jgi:periplasmic divalent cation tolerance protein
MEDACVLVLTTVATEQAANDLSHSIVSARLAACVQIQPVRSVYRWKGEVCAEPEWQLAIKTTAGRYADLELHIRANHAYETPEIVCLPIAAGSPDYLAWIASCTTSPE